MSQCPLHSLRILGCLLVIQTAAALQTQAQDSARDRFNQGMEAYTNQDFETAAKAFEAAAQAAESQGLDPAVARYNQATALARTGENDAAASQFLESMRTADLALQQMAYHNRGTTLMAKAGTQQQAQDLESAMTSLQEAASMLEQAITLDPADQAPRRNYELTLKQIEELEKLQQQQQQQDQQDQQNQDQDQEQQDEQDQQDQQDQQQDQDQEQQDQQEQQQDQQDQQQDPSNSESGEENRESESGNDSQPPPQPAEEMTREEAEMMLNAIREEERAERERIRVRYGGAVPVDKDW